MEVLKKLGNTDMHLSPVGFGAWAIGGGDWEYAWGNQDDQESINAIHAAVDNGINWIDTAAVYGLGHSERICGKAIKQLTNKPYVFTKCSLVWDENKNITGHMKADSIKKEVEDSLSRLDVEVIDLYQIHWPNPDEQIEEAWETLTDLKSEGKVRWIGVSNFSTSQMQRAMEISPVSSLQPQYSALRRAIEEEKLPYCLNNNIGVIVYSPMQSGLLSGRMSSERIKNMPDNDWRKRNAAYNEPDLTFNLSVQELFKEIAIENGVGVPQIAIAWTLYHEAVTASIVGLRKPEQSLEIAKDMNFTLDEVTYQRINSFIKKG